MGSSCPLVLTLLEVMPNQMLLRNTSNILISKRGRSFATKKNIERFSTTICIGYCATGNL